MDKNCKYIANKKQLKGDFEKSVCFNLIGTNCNIINVSSKVLHNKNYNDAY